MSIYAKPNSPFWLYDFWIDGHRFFGTLEDEAGRPLRKSERERVAKEREAVLKAETRKRLRAGTEKAKITLDDALGRYWLEHGQHLSSAANIWAYAENWRRIGRQKRKGQPIPLLNRTLDRITDDDIAWFVSVRRGDTIATAKPKKQADGTVLQPPLVAKRTVNADVEFLRSVFGRAEDNWNVDTGSKRPNWGAHLLDSPTAATRFLTLDEECALFDAVAKLRPDFADLFEFAVLSGWRLSEIIRLEKPRIDRQGMTARVIVKGGAELQRPLTAEMLEVIERNWLHHATRVFTYVRHNNKTYTQKGARVVSRKGQRMPFTKDGWRKEFDKIRTTAGLSDFTFHGFRHTTGTRVYLATRDKRAVQNVLGHADPATSDRYVHAAGVFERSSLEAAAKMRTRFKK